MTPYWLLLPGILWLLVFFALPMIYQASTSVQTGSLEEGYKVTWHFATYWDALTEYWPQFLRSVLYAGAATVLCLVLGYPLAYLIAFRAGRWRNLIMILVIAPFFTSFLIRTLAWKTILADGGPVVERAQHAARPGRHQLARAGPPATGCWPRRSRWSAV